jgi:hypothetical protein
MYQRKTYDEYLIETNYGYGWDVECTEETRKEAKIRLREYQENIQGAVRMRKTRVRIEA